MERKFIFYLTLAGAMVALTATIWYFFSDKNSMTSKKEDQIVQKRSPRPESISRPKSEDEIETKNKVENVPTPQSITSSPTDSRQKEKEKEKDLGSKRDQEKIQRSISNEEKKVFIKGREVIGPERLNYAKSGHRLEFINKYNPQWKKILFHHLHRFKPEGAKIEITKKRSYIQVFHSKGRFVEEVIISTTLQDGLQYSFQANIDSHSGEILETWNKTRHELPNKQSDPIIPPSTL